jgi:hypothetical protein
MIQIVVASKGVKMGDNALIKIGDRFKDRTTGKVYILRIETANNTLCLDGENGLGRRLTDRKSLKITCEKMEDTNS